MQLRNGAPMPEAAGCSLNVLILAGGFNSGLVADIHAKTAADTIQRDTSANMIRRTKVCARSPPPVLCPSAVALGPP